METTEPKNIDKLIQEINNDDYSIREKAAQNLAEMGDQANKALETIKERVKQEKDMITAGEFLKAIIKIDKNKTRILNDFIKYLDLPKINTKVAEILFESPEVFFNSDKETQTKALKKIWNNFESNPHYSLAKVIFKLENDPKKLNTFIRENLKTNIIGSTLLIGSLKEKLEEKEKILKDLWIELEKQINLDCLSNIYWALELQIGRENTKNKLKESTQISFWRKLYLDYLYHTELNLNPSSDDIVSFIDIPYVHMNDKIDKLFKQSPEYFNSFWKENKLEAINFILKVLGESNTKNTSIIIKWLEDWAYEIPANLIDNIVSVLKEVPKYENTEEKDRRKEILKKLQDRQRDLHINIGLENWKEKDQETIINNVKRIFKADTRIGYNALINKWLEWIVDGAQRNLVEYVREELKNRGKAILPMVSLLSKDLYSEEIIKDAVIEHVIPQPKLAEFYKKGGDNMDEHVIVEFKEWKNKLEISGRHSELLSVENPENARGFLQQMEIIIKEELKLTCVSVKRETSKKLAEMSDDSLIEFDDKDQINELKEAKKELKKYAIPVISKNLSKEEDSEIRENYSRILGNVGGREAVDALARAVVGNERTRDARQNLLSEYYLIPAKKRSEDAAQILSDAVKEARRTLSLLQWMSMITFGIGILLIAVGVWVAIFSPEGSNQLAGALSGIGGLAGIITHMVKAPLDRIQTAMANLVQIETAFTSFIWELNLNATYIQSQYVKDGILRESDISRTVERIEGAMELAMNLVSVYTDKDDKARYSILRSLNPPQALEGDVIAVYGNNLKNSLGVKNKNGIIAIDHEPIIVEIKEWTDNMVKFVLPNDFGNSVTKTHNISLFIDGIETNTLPLKVVRNTSK